MILIESYINYILSKMQTQNFVLLFAPLTESNMSADFFTSDQVYIIVNTNTLNVQTSWEGSTNNINELYSFQICFVKQHPINDTWQEMSELMRQCEDMRRNFIAQLTYESTFVESNQKGIFNFGASQTWIKEFDSNLSGWSLQITIPLDVNRAFCYNCCEIESKFDFGCLTNC